MIQAKGFIVEPFTLFGSVLVCLNCVHRMPPCTSFSELVSKSDPAAQTEYSDSPRKLRQPPALTRRIHCPLSCLLSHLFLLSPSAMPSEVESGPSEHISSVVKYLQKSRKAILDKAPANTIKADRQTDRQTDRQIWVSQMVNNSAMKYRYAILLCIIHDGCVWIPSS